MLVEDSVIVELKALKVIEEVHKAQLLTYMHLSKCKLGLPINSQIPVSQVGNTSRVT